MTRPMPAKRPSGGPRRRRLPTWLPPMLATLTEELPPGGNWIYEPKLDGVRALIYVTGRSVRMYSRNRKLLNDAYPELVEALRNGVHGEAVLDGEVVAFDEERGVSSFSRLQQRMQLRDPVRALRSQVAVHLYLFDCMHYGLAQDQMPAPAGACHWRLHRASGIARTAGCIAGRSLRRKSAPICRKGWNRIRSKDTRAAVPATTPPAPYQLSLH